MNRVTGQMAISAGDRDMDINAYEITSASDSLNPSGWQAGNLEAQGVDAVEDPGGATPGPGNDPGETWQVFDASRRPADRGVSVWQFALQWRIGPYRIDRQRLRRWPRRSGPRLHGNHYRRRTVSAFVNYFESGVLLGDVNGDGQVNGLDVDPFVDRLLNGPFQAEADMNLDGEVNGLDVDPFVAAIVGGGTAAVPEPATLGLLGIAITLVGFGWFVRRRA